MLGYAQFDHTTHTLGTDGLPLSDEHRSMFEYFSRTAMQNTFPCIGAQKAMRDFRVAFCMSPDGFNTEAGAANALQYLYRWIKESGYASLASMGRPTSFVTCVIVFPEARFNGENDAELQLWSFLRKMHELDKLQHSWSAESSSFVYDERFSMSIGEYAHFILLLSPAAITPARRFPRPMMVFNPHFIFEAMRTAELFEGWRDAIRQRERMAQNGWINPKLIDFRVGWEAPQYALTLNPVFDIGVCPFTGLSRPTGISNYDMSNHPFVADANA